MNRIAMIHKSVHKRRCSMGVHIAFCRGEVGHENFGVGKIKIEFYIEFCNFVIRLFISGPLDSITFASFPHAMIIQAAAKIATKAPHTAVTAATATVAGTSLIPRNIMRNIAAVIASIPVGHNALIVSPNISFICSKSVLCIWMSISLSGCGICTESS